MVNYAFPQNFYARKLDKMTDFLRYVSYIIRLLKAEQFLLSNIMKKEKILCIIQWLFVVRKSERYYKAALFLL